MSEEFKAITTQEEFDRAVQDRLNRQKEQIDEMKAKNEQLESEVISLKSSNAELTENAEAFNNKLAEKDVKIAGYETASMRTKIALQHGLPIDLADRLVGEDEASIKADAERLAGFVSKQQTPPPLKNTEPPLGEGKDAAYKNLVENLNLEGE